MAAALFKPIFQIVLQPMSSLFDLGNPGEHLLLLWTQNCTQYNAADWLELLDSDVKVVRRRCVMVTASPSHDPALVKYLESCGALRFSIPGFYAGVYQGDSQQFQAQAINDLSLKREFQRILRHGGRSSNSQLAKFANILPSITIDQAP
jgi:hypothetical protein